MSTLLYPTDIDCTQDITDKHFQLDKRKDLFVSVENAIVKLGINSLSFPICWFLCLFVPVTLILDLIDYRSLPLGFQFFHVRFLSLT